MVLAFLGCSLCSRLAAANQPFSDPSLQISATDNTLIKRRLRLRPPTATEQHSGSLALGHQYSKVPNARARSQQATVHLDRRVP
ncbi:hypothetical protein BD414DRAFT_492379 [Trametes punicea]|nr:hypothetical protein BD414DRAFT_492379 [Trametes punicea]